jgi:hypothetical protein
MRNDNDDARALDPSLPFIIKSEWQARIEGYSEEEIEAAKRHPQGLLEACGWRNVFIAIHARAEPMRSAREHGSIMEYQ